MARILLAEDDAEMRSFLAHCLRRAGHDVSATEDGESAASQLERRDFDLLLADVVMPGIDGVELAKRAARFASSTPSMPGITTSTSSRSKSRRSSWLAALSPSSVALTSCPARRRQ